MREKPGRGKKERRIRKKEGEGRLRMKERRGKGREKTKVHAVDKLRGCSR